MVYNPKEELHSFHDYNRQTYLEEYENEEEDIDRLREDREQQRFRDDQNI